MEKRTKRQTFKAPRLERPRLTSILKKGRVAIIIFNFRKKETPFTYLIQGI